MWGRGEPRIFWHRPPIGGGRLVVRLRGTGVVQTTREKRWATVRLRQVVPRLRDGATVMVCTPGPRPLEGVFGAAGRARGRHGLVAFGPGGRLLATAGDDRPARLWNVTDPRRPRELATLGGHRDAVCGLAPSPDGRTLATGSWDRTARPWDIADPRSTRELGTVSGHGDHVNTVTFGPGGRTPASGSAARTARLWPDGPGTRRGPRVPDRPSHDHLRPVGRVLRRPGLPAPVPVTARPTAAAPSAGGRRGGRRPPAG
ncbi:WD40 repeat domain-containing protein [Streptomyces tauricus]|uniref:WD40 repeat domain-containing protein n=1 Tax=Streptomyces tauricus TaxID=68274 RepID=UPI00387F2A56